MKIRTNYDLMYEIALAKKGMSLQHYAKTVVKYSSFGIAFVIPILATDGLTKEELIEQLIFFSKEFEFKILSISLDFLLFFISSFIRDFIFKHVAKISLSLEV